MRAATGRSPALSIVVATAIAAHLSAPDPVRSQERDPGYVFAVFAGARAEAEAGEQATDVEHFLEAARVGSERYRDRRHAIADGFRLIGPDFPGMGEHWIHLGRLMDGRLEPKAPEILSYATIAGSVRLTGVAYAVPLSPGASPPPPLGPGAVWHFHSRTVEGESFVPHGHGAHSGGREAAMHDTPEPEAGTRVAVLHAWIWLDNPAGVFARDNWALPFARLGLAAPRQIPEQAARALALASGGDRFLAAALTRRGLLTPEAGGPILARHAELARRWAEERDRGVARVTEADLAALADIWIAMWDELMGAATPDARADLLGLKDH